LLRFETARNQVGQGPRAKKRGGGLASKPARTFCNSHYFHPDNVSSLSLELRQLAHQKIIANNAAYALLIRNQ